MPWGGGVAIIFYTWLFLTKLFKESSADVKNQTLMFGVFCAIYFRNRRFAPSLSETAEWWWRASLGRDRHLISISRCWERSWRAPLASASRLPSPAAIIGSIFDVLSVWLIPPGRRQVARSICHRLPLLESLVLFRFRLFVLTLRLFKVQRSVSYVHVSTHRKRVVAECLGRRTSNYK